LRQARIQKNGPELKKQVHSLKGTSAIFGAMGTVSLCDRIQMLTTADPGDERLWAEPDGEIQRLFIELERACSILSDRLKR